MLGITWKPVIEILTGSLVSKSHMESHKSTAAKSFDLVGVGLGIVVALDKSDGGRSEIQANRVLVSRSLRRSVPVPVPVGQPRDDRRRVVEHRSLDYDRNKVYDSKGGGRKGDDRTPFRIQRRRASIFHISPPRYSSEDAGVPSPDYLNSCNLCRKNLRGKDIYMYRGEKAFCSPECRYRQIVMDQRKEKCGSGVFGSVDISGSQYSAGQASNNGILAI